MKKIISFILLAILAYRINCMRRCKRIRESADKDGNKKLVVGASAVPHAEVLRSGKTIIKGKRH